MKSQRVFVRLGQDPNGRRSARASPSNEVNYVSEPGRYDDGQSNDSF